MNKKLIVGIILGVILGSLGFLSLTNKPSKKVSEERRLSLTNENICKVNLTNYTLYLDMCPNQTLNIYTDLPNNSNFRNKYKHILIIFDPNGTGNYSVALLNFVMAFPKYFVVPVCKRYYYKCKLYLVSINNTTAVFAPVNESNKYEIFFEANLSKVLVVYLNLSNQTGIFLENKHTIFIQGNYSTIRKATDRFIYWWYGVVS